MDLTFTVAARIAKPVAEVFEAIVNPAQLSRYFTTGGAKGRLETGATVSWDFHDGYSRVSTAPLRRALAHAGRRLSAQLIWQAAPLVRVMSSTFSSSHPACIHLLSLDDLGPRHAREQTG